MTLTTPAIRSLISYFSKLCCLSSSLTSNQHSLAIHTEVRDQIDMWCGHSGKLRFNSTRSQLHASSTSWTHIFHFLKCLHWKWIKLLPSIVINGICKQVCCPFIFNEPLKLLSKHGYSCVWRFSSTLMAIGCIVLLLNIGWIGTVKKHLSLTELKIIIRCQIQTYLSLVQSLLKLFIILLKRFLKNVSIVCVDNLSHRTDQEGGTTWIFNHLVKPFKGGYQCCSITDAVLF